MADKHLTLYDLRDIDLMMRLGDHGASGATSHELAESLGMNGDIQAVAIRCAWMRRYGIFDFDEEKKLWTLSKGGERVIESKTRAAMIRQIEAVPDEQMIEVMAHVTSRYRLGDQLVATMLRREFQFGTNPRSVAFRL